MITLCLTTAALLMVFAAPAPVAPRLAGLATRRRLELVRTRADRTTAGVQRVFDRITGGATAFTATTLVTGSVDLLLGPVLALAAAAVTGTGCRLVADLVARRRARADRDAVLAAVRILTAELAAGSMPAAALTAAASAAPQVHDAFTAAAGQAARGDPATVLELDPRPGVRAVGIAWRLGLDTGTALGTVLQRVSDDLCAAAEQTRAVTVALAGPRASAMLVALLPALGLALGSAMGASPSAVLAGTQAGRVLCLAGVALDVAGVWWIRGLLRRAERA